MTMIKVVGFMLLCILVGMIYIVARLWWAGRQSEKDNLQRLADRFGRF